jgi:N-acetylglucosamine malate deacetylase 2
MSRPSYAEQILDALARNQAFAGDTSPRVLFLAAHPDDETLGASVALGRLSDRTVIFLTDGAPRDPQFRSPHVSGSREMYALVRAEEAASALALVGVPSERIMFLNAADQESIYEVERLTHDFMRVLEQVNPDVIVTHPYEGGHPDHDTAALVTSLAVAKLEREGRRCPDVLEFTSYHAVDGRRASGEFLRSNRDNLSPTQFCMKFSAEERARKARMLGCYVSQWHVLSEFPLEPECLRVAPQYDFAQPPHSGPLWYECLGWPVTGEKWREIASASLNQNHGAPTCR